jgi:lambda family phage portal protein
LVNNVVGSGIRYEPMVRSITGELHEEANNQILTLFKDWAKRPDATGEYTLAMAERLMVKTWFRDGEVFAQHLSGKVAGLTHGTQVPYSFEMIEADQVPFTMNNKAKNLVQGVVKDAWGKPTFYSVLNQHPNDLMTKNNNGKMIDAENIIHLKLVDRIRQTRGVSVFASVLRRMDDLKDYEESERIAARIAAKMVGYIKNGTAESYEANNDQGFETVEKGMFLYDMPEGSEINTIDTNRPNSGLNEFRTGQLKAIAAGTSVGYSSLAKSYDGNYASQRQEMVEQAVIYDVLENHFIAKFSRPIYEKFVSVADLSNLLDLPADVDLTTLLDVQCTGTPQPWIDPQKEIKADSLAVQSGFASVSGIIRKRGGNPVEVLAQIKRDTEMFGGDDAFLHILTNLSNSNHGVENATKK